jgi:penicillin amidase
MIFATKSGEIAITQQGEFPAKWKRQGDFPMPGFDSSYMWQGMIPANENPQMINPARGFVSSANQLPVDSTYPYYLGGSYPPYRGLIINRYLNQMNNITPQDMMRLQADNYNVFAEFARPVLLKYFDENGLNAEEKKYVDILKNWNLRNDAGETGASVFKAWWDSLELVVFRDEMMVLTQNDKYPKAAKWPDESSLLEGLIRDSTSYLFLDNINTPEIETAQFDVVKAFKAAITELKKADHDNSLTWSKFKDGGVRHLLKIPAFSRLHLNEGGGEHIINATKQWHGPSWRMIVHMTDKIEAFGVYPGGQDGNPGSKYYDTFIDYWVEGKYYPLLFLTKEEASSNSKIKWHLKIVKA